jgi:hypothetical protein
MSYPILNGLIVIRYHTLTQQQSELRWLLFLAHWWQTRNHCYLTLSRRVTYYFQKETDIFWICTVRYDLDPKIKNFPTQFKFRCQKGKMLIGWSWADKLCIVYWHSDITLKASLKKAAAVVWTPFREHYLGDLGSFHGVLNYTCMVVIQ